MTNTERRGSSGQRATTRTPPTPCRCRARRAAAAPPRPPDRRRPATQTKASATPTRIPGICAAHIAHRRRYTPAPREAVNPSRVRLDPAIEREARHSATLARPSLSRAAAGGRASRPSRSAAARLAIDRGERSGNPSDGSAPRARQAASGGDSRPACTSASSRASRGADAQRYVEVSVLAAGRAASYTCTGRCRRPARCGHREPRRRSRATAACTARRRRPRGLDPCPLSRSTSANHPECGLPPRRRSPARGAED